MKRLLPHWFLLFFLVFFVLLSKESGFQVPVTVLCCLFYAKKCKDVSCFLSMGILFLFLIFPLATAYPDFQEGKVIEVKKSYSIITNGQSRLLVYTTDLPHYDATVSFTGEIKEIQSDAGFYSFDFAKYMQRRGIFYCVSSDSVTTVSEGKSLRNWVQRKIETMPAECQNYLYSLLLHIRLFEDDMYSQLNLSLLSLLFLFRFLSKRWLVKEKREMIELMLVALLCCITHGRYLFVQRLVFCLLKKTPLTSREQFSVGYLLELFIYPYAFYSVAFLLPMFFRLTHFVSENPKSFRYFGTLVLESSFYHCVHPLKSFLYFFFLPLQGFVTVLALVQLVTGLSFLPWYIVFFRWTDWLQSIEISGSFLGAGVIFYCFLIWPLRHKKSLWIWASALFLFFLKCGYFHPLAEVTYINVGQGDCILLRSFANTENIMIDTGKKSAYTKVKAYLDAKGITKIHTLIITHPDEDHNGNQQSIIDDYHIDTVIDTHFTTYQTQHFLLQDLNEIDNDDANQSSLVIYTELFQWKYLFMGDSDSVSEKEIIKRYNGLSADILKLSHHGSKTGSCKEFLNQVRPRIAMISAGSYALYHHPSQEVIQRLLQRHITYFNTREDGDLSFFPFPRIQFFVSATLKLGTIGP